ncbi:kinase-like domain-containing protein [Xylariaceae sp. FL0255]|nr:kinase-like domain-containing protein [Xylariaceae sp. FL0255]
MQKQPSAEQESEIANWISKEISSGAISVLKHDNGVEQTLVLDFVDDFLNRHPDLASDLALPPLPNHSKPITIRLNRLQQKMQQDRRKALFGDSPPPPRQPAPYSEGDIIYQRMDRYVVRHDDKITKYTLYPDGVGTKDHPNEATVLQFVKANTTIPVPKLRGYIAQLRALKGTDIGRLNSEGVVSQSIYWHQITTQLGAKCPIIFTHGDIAARNILVRDGKIVALLDWEFAGWYPEYWEYVFAFRGLDNVDWETLGLEVSSLFAKRYDLEYIIVGFILTLS